MRLFFGLWPDTQVRAELAALARGLPLASPARLVTPANLHITLAFLGEVDDETTASLMEAAAGIRAEPFSLVLDTLGWWKKPKITWLAPTTYPGILPQLAGILHERATAAGLELDGKPYRPHVTLARKVSAPLPAMEIQPIHWQIRAFYLVESKTLESGVEYQVKASWPLEFMG